MGDPPDYGDLVTIRPPSTSVYDGPPSYDVIVHSTDNGSIQDQHDSHEVEKTSDTDSVQEPGTSQNAITQEEIPEVVMRKYSLDDTRTRLARCSDTSRFSDSQIDTAARSRTPSPRRYEKRKSYSPDIRHMRRKVLSRSPNAKYPTALENHEKAANNEDIRDNESYPSVSSSNSETHEVSSKQATAERNVVDTVVSEPTTPTTNSVSVNSKAKTGKFSVTKVNSNTAIDVNDVNKNDHCDGHGMKTNGHVNKEKPDLKLDISEKSQFGTSDVTPGDTDVINGDGVILKFKGDYLDPDMLYEWTLEKKSKYAAQIRNVKMTLQSRPPKPRDYVVLSCMVMVCCNLPFGIIALGLSLGINPKYEDGKYDTARSYSKASLVLAILGIVVTCVIVVSCLAAFWPDIENTRTS